MIVTNDGKYYSFTQETFNAAVTRCQKEMEWTKKKEESKKYKKVNREERNKNKDYCSNSGRG